jgi:hypothetical protein
VVILYTNIYEDNHAIKAVKKNIKYKKKEKFKATVYNHIRLKIKEKRKQMI